MLITGRGVIFFDAISIAIYAGWLHFLRYAELFIYFRSCRERPSTWKKELVFMPNSLLLVFHEHFNKYIHFACVHQHCQYFPIFYSECLPHAFLHSLIPLSFSLSVISWICIFLPLSVCDLHSIFFMYAVSIADSTTATLQAIAAAATTISLMVIWFWLGWLCVILIFYIVNILLNSRS